MVSLMSIEEIEEIFTNFERLKKKSAGNDSSIETRVSSLIIKLTKFARLVETFLGLKVRTAKR